jgi:V8-like Glu-specific endopeptidase
LAQSEIDNLAYPYTTFAFIRSTFPDGYIATGSGVMVGPNDVLTAAHVVYNGQHGGAETSVTVIPGYDPNPLEQPYGSVTAAVWHYFPQFDPNNDGLLSSGNGGALA